MFNTCNKYIYIYPSINGIIIDVYFIEKIKKLNTILFYFYLLYQKHVFSKNIIYNTLFSINFIKIIYVYAKILFFFIINNFTL